MRCRGSCRAGEIVGKVLQHTGLKILAAHPQPYAGEHAHQVLAACLSGYQDVQGEGDEVGLLVGEELAVNFGVGQIWPDQQGGGCG